MELDKVLNYSYDDLVNWLRNEAGSSNPDYFKAIAKGGWKLQQVPEEYAKLLMFFKNSDIKTYLELGIGNGGSFALNNLFLLKSCNHSIAVDNFAYGNLIGQNEVEVMNYIEDINPYIKHGLSFYKVTTNEFFSSISKDFKFDCIFIDADHSYEGVKNDYENSLKHLNEGGYLIFHDINSNACPGVVKIWNEVISKPYKHYMEFIESDTCGIGVIKI